MSKALQSPLDALYKESKRKNQKNDGFEYYYLTERFPLPIIAAQKGIEFPPSPQSSPTWREEVFIRGSCEPIIYEKYWIPDQARNDNKILLSE
jgi:hypothetical protein